MGVLVRKNQGNIILTRIARLAVIGFITALAGSFIDTIWAVYLNKVLGNISWTGFFSSFLTIVAFFAYFFSIPFVEKNNKAKLYSISLVFYAIVYFLFAVNTNAYVFIALAIIITLLGTLRVTSFGIIVRDKSKQTELARNEGVMYTIINVAWVIGPLISGLLSELLGISFIFLISATFILLALISFRFSKIEDSNLRKKIDRHPFRNFKEFFKNKNRVLAYILGGGIPFWWALIYLFVPIFITQQGLPIQTVGFFLFAIAVPLIILEYVFAKTAGKIGFKHMFRIGFFILFVASFACFLMSDMPILFGVKNIYPILGVLIVASVGAAMCEPTAEAYFFDSIKGKEELHFYGPYNTNLEVSRLIAYSLPSLILLFFPFKFVFLFFSAIMMGYVILSFIIREVIEKRRHPHKNNR